MEFFDKYTIRKEFEEWGLEAIRAMNDEGSNQRQCVIEQQTSALKSAETKANNLLNLVAEGVITKEQYSQKVAETTTEIERLRKELDNTLNNGKDWRRAMGKTLEVLFNGRERFEKGDMAVKREVLQSLGSSIIIKDGKLSIDTYKWLKPVEKSYQFLEYQLLVGSNTSLQIKKRLK